MPARAQVGAPPIIVVQPLDQIVLSGGTAEFTVVASSMTTMHYQWQFNGVDIGGNGSKNSTLVVAAASQANVGRYSVRVWNNSGSVTSSAAYLGMLPTSYNDTYTAIGNTFLSVPPTGILNNDISMDGSALTALLVNTVSHGNLNLNPDGGFAYVPNPGFSGSDSFSYCAQSTLGTGNVATVTINVQPDNQPPVAVDDVANTSQDVSVTINVLANDMDPEGTPLTITGATTTNGMVMVTGSDIVYMPAPGFNGIAVLSYTISDGTNSATANVTVTVASVNAAPIANPDSYTLIMNSSLTIPAPGVLANDTDAENGPLSTLLELDATHGSVALQPDGSFTYQPASNYSGTDSFTYRVTDGSGFSASATVSITIYETITPVIVGAAAMTDKGFSFQITGPAPATYIILASTNLRDWTPISTNDAPTGMVEFTDATAAGHPLRWYQAIVETGLIKATP